MNENTKMSRVGGGHFLEGSSGWAIPPLSIHELACEQRNFTITGTGTEEGIGEGEGEGEDDEVNDDMDMDMVTVMKLGEKIK